MTVATDQSQLRDLPLGSHVCWVVGDPDSYIDATAALLAHGQTAGQKTFLFGPAGSDPLVRLGAEADVVADPRIEFLNDGPLRAETMLARLGTELTAAAETGYSGIRVVADMDWLLPTGSASEHIVGFELLLDRLVSENDATVICAYRQSLFDTDASNGVLSVHPLGLGLSGEPQFRLVAAEDRTWRLSGQVDLAVASAFEAAFATAATDRPCVVDVSGLEFIDGAGLRVIARAGGVPDSEVVLRSAPPMLRRVWQVGELDRLAPGVHFRG